mmetsp:Transcript_6017/g.14584  ORF Transcript_6017/g.14584 Transcript_6017/m.14584 type:complete len:217 (-) Transcript_6017:71-721(-)
MVVSQELEDSGGCRIFATGCRKFSGHGRFGGHTSLSQALAHNAHGQIHHDCFALEISLVAFDSRLPFKDQSLVQTSHFGLKFAANEDLMNVGLITPGFRNNAFVADPIGQDGTLEFLSVVVCLEHYLAGLFVFARCRKGGGKGDPATIVHLGHLESMDGRCEPNSRVWMTQIRFRKIPFTHAGLYESNAVFYAKIIPLLLKMLFPSLIRLALLYRG